MTDIILCIDDDPLRYHELAKLVAPRYLVLVHYDPEMVDIALEFYRGRIVGVCLDHDMPTMNGQDMAKHYLIDKTLRVAITSANHVGARKIEEILRDYEVECLRLSADISTTNRAQFPQGWAAAVADYLQLDLT